jgi:hypothetical protein
MPRLFQAGSFKPLGAIVSNAMVKLRSCAVLLLLALGGCGLWGGGEAPPPPPPRTDVLAPGDNVWIAVAGEESLSGLYPVRGDGTVWMELLGALPAAGVALPVFQENLRQRLAAGYLRQPVVAVTRVTTPPAPSLRQSQ